MKVFDLGRQDPVWKVYEKLAAEAEAGAREFHKGPKRFRASEVADCRRKIWYRVGGFVPEPSEPWLNLVADSGNFHHDYARHIGNWAGMGITGFAVVDGKQEEEKYSSKVFEYGGQTFELSCRPDGYIELPSIGAKAVVDIKSMSGFAFPKAESAWKKGPENLLAHLQSDHQNYLWQGNVTAMIRELNHVYLLLVGRSGNHFGLGVVGAARPGTWDPLRGRRAGGLVWELEDADRENILAKLAEINRALDDGKAPAPDFPDGSSECGMCPFYVYCHGAKRKMKYPVEGVL